MAYKSLEVHNQVIEGWVRDVKVNLNEYGLAAVKEKVGYATVQLLYITICYSSINKLWNYYTVLNILIIFFLGFAFTKIELPWAIAGKNPEGVVWTLCMYGRISRGLHPWEICYRVKFRSMATEWGIEHENAAKENYFSIFSSSHENWTIRDWRLIISPNYPYIGASPDTIVERKCCGVRCLEIKCPYSHRRDSIPQMLEKNL